VKIGSTFRLKLTSEVATVAVAVGAAVGEGTSVGVTAGALVEVAPGGFVAALAGVEVDEDVAVAAGSEVDVGKAGNVAVGLTGVMLLWTEARITFSAPVPVTLKNRPRARVQTAPMKTMMTSWRAI
jgi:hypothetical protein